MAILVLPLVAGPIEIVDGRRIGMTACRSRESDRRSRPMAFVAGRSLFASNGIGVW